MKNNWSDKEESKYIMHYKKLGYNSDIAIRVYSTRLLGRNQELVIHGGGNTSVKTKVRDIDSKKCEVLCIKGSGWDMADIEPEGLPAVKLSPLIQFKNRKHLKDNDMVAYQKRNLINTNSPNPSVETFVHAFLPHKYVDHTHSNAIVTLTNRTDGKNLCKKIFGPKVGIVPYVMPGFELAKKAYDIYILNPDIECLVLLNHGIFTFADDAKKSYSLMIKYVSIAERALKKLRKKKNIQVKKNNFSFKPHEVSPILRGLLSHNNRGRKFVVNYRSTNNLNYFLNNKNIKRISYFNMATPLA